MSRTRNSSILVMAIHGCKIEPGTTELAQTITRGFGNFYSFCGKLSRYTDTQHLFDPELHVTSTHFDDPVLQAMTSSAKDCLSLHGRGNEKIGFCIGGGNEAIRKKLRIELQKEFPQDQACVLCCPPYHGLSKKNPVNQCANPGVQIEMSASVRKKILKSDRYRKKLAQVLKKIIQRTVVK